jgi:ABC-type branched-subunit amino acid transport system ATPase component
MVVGSNLKSGGKGWNACNMGVVTFTTGGCKGNTSSISCHGAVVSSYQVTAEVEGLTVMENVVIDFVSLS